MSQLKVSEKSQQEYAPIIGIFEIKKASPRFIQKMGRAC